jgi:hypothetical protein
LAKNVAVFRVFPSVKPAIAEKSGACRISSPNLRANKLPIAEKMKKLSRFRLDGAAMITCAAGSNLAMSRADK